MNILDRVVAHYNQKEVTRIEVPEWPDENGKPTVMFSQPWSLEDRRKLVRASSEDENEFLIRLLILKLEDENGEKVFDLSHKPALLKKADPNIVSRITGQIMKSLSVEEQSGN